MMGRISRNKGRAFEQRIASDIRRVLPRATVRRSLQAHAAYEPDIVIAGDVPAIWERLWIECHDARRPDIRAKWAQATRDSAAATLRGASSLPLVVWHRTGERSVYCTADLSTWVEVAGLSWSRSRDGTSGDGVRHRLFTAEWETVLDVLSEQSIRTDPWAELV